MKTTPKTKLILSVLALVTFLLGIVVAKQFQPTASSGGGGLTPIAGAKYGGDFTLTQGETVTRLSDFKGKVVVMYFGYASCPDVCPTSMALIGSAVKALEPEEAEQVQGFLVSVDPTRDPPEKLMKYASFFYPTFIGASGTDEEVRKAAKQYGAYFAKEKSESALDYLVNHSSLTYIIDKKGEFHSFLRHDMTKPDIIEAIRAAL